MIKKGYSVTWVDLSEQMIFKANKPHLASPLEERNSNNEIPPAPYKGEGARGWGLSFEVWDMTSINLEKEFDIVLCNYNSVCHLPDWEAWILFFENAYKHLKKDGVLIFDILTLFEFENISRDYKWFFNVGGDTICLEMFKENFLPLDLRGDAWKAEGIVFKWLIKMFVDNGGNQFELIEEEIREISFTIEKIKKQLEWVWFSIEHLEDFHFGEVTAESERVYFVVKK